MSFYMSLPRLIIQCNFAAVIILILLGIFICTNASFTKEVNARFFTICFSTLFLTISDNLRFITAHMTEPTIWRYLSASGGYTIRPLIIFLLATLAGRRSKIKLNFRYAVPLFLNGLISFLSCLPIFRGIMFSFDENNVFIRGIFGFLPYIVSFFYILLILYLIIKKTVVSTSEVVIIIAIIVLGSIATVMESKFRYDLILSQVLIIGTVFYFLFLNVQVYKHDTLTQLENRRCFYLELEKIKKTDFVIVSMDLNDLKLYNDTLGHAAGDEALQICTEYMQKAFPKNCKLYRIGGDEFITICKNISLTDVEKIIEVFQKNISSTIYRVACGIAQYHAGDDMDKVISISDAAMYENKQFIKSSN